MRSNDRMRHSDEPEDLSNEMPMFSPDANSEEDYDGDGEDFDDDDEDERD